MREELAREFGIGMTELIYRWKCDRASIRELEEETGIRGLNYHLNKMVKWCKINYCN